MQEHKLSDVRRAAMNLLARREHSFLELQQKLSKRFDSSKLINQAVESLANDGLQCDQRFAESYIRSKSQRGIGPVRLRQELKQKGVDSHIIQIAFDENNIDWWHVLEACVIKKFGELSFSNQDEKAKCLRFLAYRGFSNDMIFTVIN